MNTIHKICIDADSYLMARGDLTARKQASRSDRIQPRRDRGAGLVELAVVLPLWLIVFFGGVELFLMTTTYLKLQQVVREGLHSAAIGPRLQCPSNSSCQDVDRSQFSQFLSACIAVNNPSNNCAALITHQRMRELLRGMDIRAVNGADGVTLTIVGDPSPITIRAELRYDSLLNLFEGWPISIKATGTSTRF